MVSSLLPLLRYAPSVLGTVADFFIPGSGAAVQKIAEQGKEWYADKRSAEEKAEILKALRITEEKLNAFDRMFILLGRDCHELLARVDTLERQGKDATDEIVRAMVANPALQAQFDQIGGLLARLDGRVSVLEAEVQRLNEQYASVGAFAAEAKRKQLLDTELADFRAFRQAKQFQAAGRFAESEPILLKLANTQPKSAAVAVAQAVARHDDPANFERAIRRAERLRPDDDVLKQLAAAATVAVTRAHTPSASPTKPTARVPQVGDTLDGWLLETRLGGGGWGIVFRATKKGLTRALKVMRPDLSTREEFVEAFQTEAFKLNRLRHANVVAVERNGYCTAHHCHYFVMPLLDGLNLEQHLAAHGVPSADVAMGWLTGLLDGLEHAHANGLIHRDIKPQNVMIQPDGRAVLIDFGIAGLEGVPGETQAIGVSKFYAPPELHSLGEADARADLFMLAATLFYALRCDQPLRERAYHEYETELVPDVFRKAFEAALASKRGKRPASAAEMRKLLWADVEAEYEEYLDDWKIHSGTTNWLKRNLSRVPRWEQSATEGCVPAMVLFGDCYRDGIGVPKKFELALQLFRKAADAGNASGMNQVGMMYNHGHGVPQDYAEALRWYRKAADAGDAGAMRNIGLLYRNGEGVPQDYAEAMTWFRKAADAGDSDAMYSIGLLYDNGHGVPQDYAEAMAWFRKATEAGDTNAMCNVGGLYGNGHGVPQDYAEAMAWFRKAADAGNANAMCWIGAMYCDRQGVPQDYAEAMAWFRKAADAGNASGMFQVGVMYYHGDGVSQDYAEAMRWSRKAADAGNANAMRWIGVMYHNGVGVTKSLQTAIEWYEKAITAGDKNAETHLAEARRELNGGGFFSRILRHVDTLFGTKGKHDQTQ